MTKARDLSTVPNQSLAFKNRMINGGMTIDQRNNGASVTVNTWTVFTTDRFFGSFRPSTGTVTAQQVSDAPTGFRNSLRLTQASVTALSASDYYGLVHRVEGFNTADLMFGTANPSTITLSFWVKSSVTGTYGLSLQNVNATRRSYVTTYTINAANTWEYKTIVVVGDTSGTWETTNSTGIAIQWDFGSGSDYQSSTLNAWQTNNVVQASGATRWIATSGATWQITGVQLERGSTATSFDTRSYGQELALCQRYFYSNIQNANGGFFGNVYAGGTALAVGTARYSVTMRAVPTIVLYDANTQPAGTATQLGIADNIPATAGAIGTNGFYALNRTSGNFNSTFGYPIIAGFTASSEL